MKGKFQWHTLGMVVFGVQGCSDRNTLAEVRICRDRLIQPLFGDVMVGILGEYCKTGMDGNWLLP